MDKNITETTIHNKMWKEFTALERSVENARNELEACEQNMREFKSAVRSGNTTASVFGVTIIGWKDERHLPNGESYIIDQGSDETIEPDSIAADLEYIEKNGGNAEEVIENFSEQLDDYFCGGD
jgi:hypothetical protein